MVQAVALSLFLSVLARALAAALALLCPLPLLRELSWLGMAMLRLGVPVPLHGQEKVVLPLPLALQAVVRSAE